MITRWETYPLLTLHTHFFVNNVSRRRLEASIDSARRRGRSPSGSFMPKGTDLFFCCLGLSAAGDVWRDREYATAVCKAEVQNSRYHSLGFYVLVVLPDLDPVYAERTKIAEDSPSLFKSRTGKYLKANR